MSPELKTTPDPIQKAKAVYMEFLPNMLEAGRQGQWVIIGKDKEEPSGFYKSGEEALKAATEKFGIVPGKFTFLSRKIDEKYLKGEPIINIG